MDMKKIAIFVLLVVAALALALPAAAQWWGGWGGLGCGWGGWSYPYWGGLGCGWC